MEKTNTKWCFGKKLTQQYINLDSPTGRRINNKLLY